MAAMATGYKTGPPLKKTERNLKCQSNVQICVASKTGKSMRVKISEKLY